MDDSNFEHMLVKTLFYTPNGLAYFVSLFDRSTFTAFSLYSWLDCWPEYEQSRF